MIFRRNKNGFTLIELMVALVIASVLTLIALPVAREALRQHTVSRSAEIVRQVFLNARAQAIRQNRPFGVAIHRLGDTGIRADYANRLTFAAAAPVYRGDTPTSRATVYGSATSNPYEFELFFPIADAARLYRDVQLYNHPNLSQQERNQATLRDGAQITLDDTFGPLTITDSATGTYKPYGDGTLLTVVYPWPNRPSVSRPLTIGAELPFAIRGLPQDSFLPDVQMPRDAVIDLSISGVGLRGLQFNSQSIRCGEAAPPDPPSSGFERVTVMFNGSGNVKDVIYEEWDGAEEVYRLDAQMTSETIYIAVGRADGVRPLDQVHAFDTAEDNRGELPNFASPETVWLTIRGSSGSVALSPQPPAIEPRPNYYASRGLSAPASGTDCAARQEQLDILRERVQDGRRLARSGSQLE